VHIPHSNPKAGEAAWAEVDEDTSVRPVQRTLAQPCSVQERIACLTPRRAVVIDRAASARLSFLNGAGDRAAAASLPKATLKMKSCRPPGSRRWKRDDVTELERDGIELVVCIRTASSDKRMT